MTARPAKARRSRDELSSAILRAATALFAEKGYAEPSIRTIAQAADVALPTLYRFFVDKRDIYVQCARQAMREMRDAQDAALDESLRPEVGLYKRLRAYAAACAAGAPGPALINRIYFDGEEAVLEEEMRSYRTSRWYLEMVEVAERGSDCDVPKFRMLVLTTFSRHITLALRQWPESADGLQSFDIIFQKLLAILLPYIDWSEVAREAGSTAAQEDPAQTVI